MNKSVLLSLLILFVFGLAAHSQSLSRTDIQGNKYVWDKDELIKYNTDNQILYKWQNPTRGTITWIDATDPFRILIYTGETNQIIWLNNKLSQIGDPVNLNEINIFNPLGIAVAKDGGIWILDAGLNKLLKYDKRFQLIIESPIRIFETLDKEIWLQIVEWKQFLAILVPEDQLWIADLYGQLLKKVPCTALTIESAPDGIMLSSHLKQEVYLPNTGQFKSLIKKP